MKIPLVMLSLALTFQVSSGQAQTLRTFIRNCAWGTAMGAGLGVVSMAVSDKPGDSWRNVAKGASLGLYAGVGYGAYQAFKEPEKNQYPEYGAVESGFAILPQFREGQIQGVQISGLVYSF